MVAAAAAATRLQCRAEPGGKGPRDGKAKVMEVMLAVAVVVCVLDSVSVAYARQAG